MRRAKPRASPAVAAGVVVLAAAVLAPRAGFALAARFGDPVVVRGRPVVVRVELLDDPGVVVALEITLEAPGGAVRTRSAERDGAWWTARFPAEIWSTQPERLLARATAKGRRGGVVLELGADAPLELEVLAPEAAARREQDLRRTERLLAAEAGELELAALVALETRLADRARVRAVIGVEAPVARTLSVAARVTVGPSFAPPADRPGGALGLGIEALVRARSGPPLPGLWTTYAGPRLGAELRLPGVDAFAGLEAGLQYGLSPQAALEVGLLAALSLLHLADDVLPVELGFSGGLRAGVRLGGTGS